MGSGVLAGFPVVDVRATLIGTYYHEVVTLIAPSFLSHPSTFSGYRYPSSFNPISSCTLAPPPCTFTRGFLPRARFERAGVSAGSMRRTQAGHGRNQISTPSHTRSSPSLHLPEGSYHELDSSVRAFQLAARGAFKEGMGSIETLSPPFPRPCPSPPPPLLLFTRGLIPRGGLECAGVPAGGTRRVQVKEGMGKASPRLVEPVMKVEVVTPEDHMGDVIGDLNSRRGQINSFGDKPGGMKVVDALVPLSEMFNYVSNLRGMTKGRANYTMQLAQFDIVPTNIQNQITAKAQGTAV
ncbi:unnamed protein product [Closterium sp. NIES-65]|nr:unnamed protein product [Closterium sp. NIES-65]CAI6001685.1 unnamed protein product [Closterium sp. NIES-65]